MKKYIFLFLLAFVLNINESFAQCPMCKMSAESNLKSGGTGGRGLNAGILYLLVTPYLLVGTLGYLWWRGQKKMERSVEIV
jgi:hypothetical protein